MGLAVANAISAIVFQKFDSSIPIKEFVSNTQSLHNKLFELTTSNPVFKLSNEILALLLVIKLPRDQFNSLIQNLLSDLKNFSTDSVFNRLLTKSQSMKTNGSDDTAMAYSATQKPRKAPKGDQSSKEPMALCHLPSHPLSMHSNVECRTQNPSLNQPRNPRPSRPMGQTTLAPAPAVSRGLSAVASLTNAEKARLFDHLQTAHANSIATNLSVPPIAEPSSPDEPERTVYFSNVHSAVAQRKPTFNCKYDMVLDTGADQFILHSAERFTSMVPIEPIAIKTADESCHLYATHRGDASIESFDDEGCAYTMIMPDSLYCKDISVNLVSAMQLCDIGCTSKGNSMLIAFQHPGSGQLFAQRQSNSNKLWTIRPRHMSMCLAVSTDDMHQRMGHLHSAALRRFCNPGGKSSGFCTLCIHAKSHRHSFQSSLPQANLLLYRVHSDVVGPFQTPTPSGNQYFVSFINEFSRFTKIYLLKHKSEVFDRFCEYLTKVEHHSGERLCILKCDWGGEYSSSRFLAFTATHGILMEQGPASTPEHNSVAKRYNRTIMERSRAKMIHAALPKSLWGEVVLATSHILNLSPTSSATDLPVNTWQHACAGSGAHLADHAFLRVIGCQALAHIPKTHRRKLDKCAKILVHVGYEAGSKAYILWDPNTNCVQISRDVTFNKSYFPLWDSSIHQLPSIHDNYEIDESADQLVSAHAVDPTSTVVGSSPSPSSSPPTPSPPLSPSSPLPSPPLPLSNTSPLSPVSPIAPVRPSRSTRPPACYGNFVSYAAGARGVTDADNLTYAQAMASPDAAHWRAAMQVGFDSLVSHSVGRLIKRPSNAKVLGGMWQFRRKRDTSGQITKYKARWVILGNHQIHGINYFETYASVGFKESLTTLYALAESEDLGIQSFGIITAFLTGSMDVPVHSVQVKGFEDQSKDILLLDQSIYGAKQAHCQFNATLKIKLASMGFHSTKVVDSLYSKWVARDFVHIHMHVDDGLVVSNSPSMVSTTRNNLSRLYDVKWNTHPTKHLGIKINRDCPRHLLHLSQ